MQNDNFQYAIALTGGIATGKSTVSSLFMLHGFLVIDADKVAHSIIDRNYKDIEKIFGTEYVENKKVLRKKLGNLVFHNKLEKIKLENFIHPIIKNEISKLALVFEKQKKPYIIDIPLFFENNNYKISTSILVYAPIEIQIARLQKRDDINKKEAIIRIKNQMSIEKKIQNSTYIIDNTKDLKHLQNEVDRIRKELIK